MFLRPTVGCLALIILVAGCANKEADAPVAAAAASAQAAKSSEGSSAPLPSTIPESFHMWEECAGKDFVVEADKLSLGIHDCRLLNVLAASTDTVKVKARCTELGDDVGEKLITLVRTGKGVDFDSDDGSIQCTGYEYKPTARTAAPQTASEVAAPREPTEDDKIAQAYAKELTADWSHANHCFDLLQQLYRYTGTGEPAAAQMRRMDQIFDGAVRAGCIRGQ